MARKSHKAKIAPAPRCLLDRLPIEVLSIICSKLSVPDISSFRSTCKSLAKVGERHLVRNLHLMYHAKSFDNLLSISRHPVLRNYVTSIFYEFRVLEDIDQRGYESNILDNEVDDWELREVLEAGDAKDILARGWRGYKKLLNAQEYMMKTHYDVRVLSQAFTRFPVLRKLYLSTELNMVYRPTEELVHAFGDTLAIPGTMMRAGEEEVGLVPLNSLLQAASGFPGNLETLKVNRVHWTFFNPPPPGLNFHRPMFTHLRHLDITFEADWDDIEEEEIVIPRHIEFGKALRSATGLESMRLTLGHGNITPDSMAMQRGMTVPVVWDTLVEEMTWPNLHTLELNDVTASESSMIEFLTRHSKTLKSISWGNMYLTESANWQEIFDLMKHDLKLEELVFDGTWGAEDGEGVEGMLEMSITGKEFARTILGREEKKKKNFNRERAASDSELSIKKTPFYKPIRQPTFLDEINPK